MAKISFKGLDKLEKKLIQNVKMEEVKKVVRDNGLTLQGNVGITPACAGNTPFQSLDDTQIQDHPRMCG